MPVSVQARKRKMELEALAMAGNADEGGSFTDFAESTGGRFNKGLVDLINFPTDLINSGIRLAYNTWSPAQGSENAPQLPSMGQAERQWLADRNIIPNPNQPAEGILENTFELLGASAIPQAGLTVKGNQLLNASLKELQNLGVIQNMARGTAARPLASATGELAASVGSATGRTIAEENDAPPGVVMMAELLGGFSPAAFVGGGSAIARRIPMLRVMKNSLQKHLAPFTKEGGWQRASKRMRDLAADPDATAARIKDDSPLPPARQAGDPELLGLEKSVLASDPEISSQYTKELNVARESLRNEALDFFGGDPKRPRQLLVKAKNYLLDLLDLRAAKAGADLEGALSKMDPGADPRSISSKARQIVGEAFDDARATEKQLWEALDSTKPAAPATAKAALNKELAARTRFADPDDVPKWLTRALGDPELSPQLRKTLQQAGAIDSNGDIVPRVYDRLVDEGIIPKQDFTFNELKDIRSRVLGDIRTERQGNMNRNKIRILNNVADGLLDDMAESGVEGVDAAREFSKALNDKFTRGQVGRLFGYDKTDVMPITPETTLDALLSVRDPNASISQLIKAAPANKPLIRDFIVSEFIGATDNGANKRAAQQFIRRWNKKGAFETFPDLKNELESVSKLSGRAATMSSRAQKARSFAHKSGKSTLALYLDTDPTDEMSALLNSRRPTVAARKLKARLGGDVEAERGLRTHFLEEGFQRAETQQFYPDGSPIYSGKKFTSFLDNHKSVAKSLGVSDQEWRRLEDIALRMRQLEARPESVDGIVKDAPAAILDLAARYIGAQQGGRLGNNMGSSLVLAGGFSDKVRQQLNKLTRNTARQLIIDAHSDPKLYRALLTKPTMPKPRQEKAALTIQSWLAAVGATEEDE